MYEFAIFKPNKSNSGVAAKINTKGKVSFMRLSHQFAPMGSDKMFNWDAAVDVKLNANDMGWFKAVLRGRINEIPGSTPERPGLFHKTAKDTKSIRLEYVEGRGFRLNVNKKPNGGELITFSLSLNFAEAENLLDFLTLASEEMFTPSYKKKDD